MSKKIIRTISWPLVAINTMSALVMVAVGLLAASGKQNDGDEGHQQFMFDGIQRAMADTPASSSSSYGGTQCGGSGGVSSNCNGGCSNCDGTSSGSDSTGDSK